MRWRFIRSFWNCLTRTCLTGRSMGSLSLPPHFSVCTYCLPKNLFTSFFFPGSILFCKTVLLFGILLGRLGRWDLPELSTYHPAPVFVEDNCICRGHCIDDCVRSKGRRRSRAVGVTTVKCLFVYHRWSIGRWSLVVYCMVGLGPRDWFC